MTNRLRRALTLVVALSGAASPPRARPPVSRRQKGQSGGRLSRGEGRRSVSLARRRQLRRDGRVGRGRERGHVPLSRGDSVPRGAAGAREGTEPVPKYLRPLPEGAVLLHHQERGHPEPRRPLHPEGDWGHAGSPDQSQRVGARTAPPARHVRTIGRREDAVYSIATNGADWQRYKVMELATKSELPDTINWVKVSGVAWQGDGFYYSRYPEPAKGKDRAGDQRSHRVYFHKVGTPQSDDRRYTGRGQPAALPHRRDDRRRAVRHPDGVGSRQGQGRQRSSSRAISRAASASSSPSSGHRRRLLRRRGQRRRQAARRDQPRRAERPRRSVDPKEPEEANWKTILPERAEPLQGVAPPAAGSSRPTSRTSRRGRTSPAGRHARERNRAARPGQRRRIWRQPRRHVRVLHLQLAQRAADDLPLRHRHGEEHALPPVRGAGLRPRRLRPKQVFYPSKDGAKIPIFLVHKKGLKLDGTNRRSSTATAASTSSSRRPSARRGSRC